MNWVKVINGVWLNLDKFSRIYIQESRVSIQWKVIAESNFFSDSDSDEYNLNEDLLCICDTKEQAIEFLDNFMGFTKGGNGQED